MVAGLAVDLSFSWTPTAGLLVRDGVPLEMRAKARVACVRRILVFELKSVKQHMRTWHAWVEWAAG
eukprot:11354965-Heterocapsa_arctica.AAC.1